MQHHVTNDQKHDFKRYDHWWLPISYSTNKALHRIWQHQSFHQLYLNIRLHFAYKNFDDQHPKKHRKLTNDARWRRQHSQNIRSKFKVKNKIAKSF